MLATMFPLAGPLAWMVSGGRPLLPRMFRKVVVCRLIPSSLNAKIVLMTPKIRLRANPPMIRCWRLCLRSRNVVRLICRKNGKITSCPLLTCLVYAWHGPAMICYIAVIVLDVRRRYCWRRLAVNLEHPSAISGKVRIPLSRWNLLVNLLKNIMLNILAPTLLVLALVRLSLRVCLTLLCVTLVICWKRKL